MKQIPMKQIFKRGLPVAVLAFGISNQALAHVAYTDITNLGPAGTLDTGFTSYGWGQGQIQPSSNPPSQGALVSSDEVSFYSFTLTKPSDINLSVNSTGYNPVGALGFSLYSGLLVRNAWDFSQLAGYSATAGEKGLVNTAASFTMTTDTSHNATQTSIDHANAVDTANIRTIDYLTSATNGGTGAAALTNYLLGPGSYTVVTGGDNPWSNDDDEMAIYTANVSFSATPAAVSAVPVPAAFWLMGSALVSLRLFGQRKNQLAA